MISVHAWVIHSQNDIDGNRIMLMDTTHPLLQLSYHRTIPQYFLIYDQEN